MEWLLILSALLNAATGAFTGTRGLDTAARHEASVEAVAVAQSATAVTVAVAARPAVTPGPAMADAGHPPVTDAPSPRAPLETVRLIE